MIPVDRFGGRLAVFGALFVVSFARFLARHHYGVFYPEVAVGLLLFVVAAAFLAAITPWRWAFAVVVVGVCVALSMGAERLDFFPHAHWRFLIGGTAALLAAGLFVFKRHFYTLLLIFVVGSIVPDLFRTFRPEISTVSGNAPPGKYAHVVHIILDEMMGFAATPAECPECVDAMSQFRIALSAGNFRIYPNAYSNYVATHDSIPSILNGRLLHRQGEFVLGGLTRPYLHENAYFDHYRRMNYDILVYQSDDLLYSSPEYAFVKPTTYNVTDLSLLHKADFSWTERLQQLFRVYFVSDKFWMEMADHAVPGVEDKLGQVVSVVPLAASGSWPEPMLRDFRNAKRNTLFFAHLLMPHSPYLLKADGSLRPHSDWKGNDTSSYVAFDSVDEYRERYRLYGAQAGFVARRIGVFLRELKATGLYDQTTIVIHGDHGSRIYLARPIDRVYRQQVRATSGPTPQFVRYNYTQPPPARDVVDRFGTLLAIKLPGDQQSQIVNEPGSVLRVLNDTFHYAVAKDSPDALETVYLFDPAGRPRGIPGTQAFADFAAEHAKTGGD